MDQLLLLYIWHWTLVLLTLPLSVLIMPKQLQRCDFKHILILRFAKLLAIWHQFLCRFVTLSRQLLVAPLCLRSSKKTLQVWIYERILVVVWFVDCAFCRVLAGHSSKIKNAPFFTYFTCSRHLRACLVYDKIHRTSAPCWYGDGGSFHCALLEHTHWCKGSRKGAEEKVTTWRIVCLSMNCKCKYTSARAIYNDRVHL